MANNNVQQFNEMVSVVFALEGQVEATINIFKNIREQTYKNVEYVFVHPQNFDIEKFKTDIYDQTDLGYDIPTKFVSGEYGVGLVDAGIEQAEGAIIFLKTTGPVLWYPGHIEAHIKKHVESKLKKSLVLSKVEFKNITINPRSPFSTIGYRYGSKVNPNEILVDELSFTPDVNLRFVSFSLFVDEQSNLVEAGIAGSRSVYDPKKLHDFITKDIRTFKFADSVTVIAMMPTQDRMQEQQKEVGLTNPDWSAVQTIQTVTDDLEIRHQMPTLFGNSRADEQWNDHIRRFIEQYSTEIKEAPDQRIIVKRTVGMGDVIETEPVLRYLKKTFPKAELWFVTGNTRGCAEIAELFGTKPDRIISMPESNMFVDVLGQTNLPKLLVANEIDPDTKFDLRFDLDLAYESRPRTRFVDAYFQTIGVDVKDLAEKDLIPILSRFSNLPGGVAGLNANVLTVCLPGSGWQGKELNVENAKSILTNCVNRGYQLEHCSKLPEKYESLRSLFLNVNDDEDFEAMMRILRRNVCGFIGADNGPLHIASAFGLPIFTWNGAALTEYTSAKKKNLTVLSHKELSCLGCKHDMFYQTIPISETQITITFVPPCKNEKQYACMDVFEQSVIDESLEQFFNILNQQ